MGTLKQHGRPLSGQIMDTKCAANTIHLIFTATGDKRRVNIIRFHTRFIVM
jgi:hypothetical protein